MDIRSVVDIIYCDCLARLDYRTRTQANSKAHLKLHRSCLVP